MDKLNIDRKKIFLIPPRCDSKLFNKKNINQQKPKKFRENKYNLLFVGNLLIAKGVDILLEAFEIVCNKSSNFELTIVGRPWKINKSEMVEKFKSFKFNKWIEHYSCKPVTKSRIKSTSCWISS